MQLQYLIIALIVFIRRVKGLNNFADVECGKVSRQSKIVGGVDASAGEFPWLVSITRRGGHFCGGSIITKNYVLTAGHCVCSGIDNDILKASSIKVTLGQHDLRSKESTAYEVAVKSITTHPGYSCRKAKNDIAILELDNQVLWSQNIAPACLPASNSVSGYDKFENILATVAGWGWTNQDSSKGGRANVLQKARVNVLDNDKCRQWYKSQGKKTKIQDTQMCAGHEQGGIDSCWADSGGPLMVNSENHVMVIGVVSTGIGCARPFLPGLYTRVSDYIEWIESEIKA